MLLHLVLVAVRATGMASPKAVLAELVVVALLASVPETHHTLTPAIGTLHGMENLREGEKTGQSEWQGRKGGTQGDRTNFHLQIKSMRWKTKPNIKKQRGKQN